MAAPEISHVRFGVRDQASLNRILREGGAQSFPQWLYAEPAAVPQILWWGVRDAAAELLEVPSDPARVRLVPRSIDDWAEAPRGLVLATVDADRAAAELGPALGSAWQDAGTDPLLGARCRRLVLRRSVLVLAEPSTEGYVAACLARFGEGPIAVVLDGTTAAGLPAAINPVSGGPATYARVAREPTAPTFIFLPVGQP